MLLLLSVYWIFWSGDGIDSISMEINNKHFSLYLENLYSGLVRGNMLFLSLSSWSLWGCGLYSVERDECDLFVKRKIHTIIVAQLCRDWQIFSKVCFFFSSWIHVYLFSTTVLWVPGMVEKNMVWKKYMFILFKVLKK